MTGESWASLLHADSVSGPRGAGQSGSKYSKGKSRHLCVMEGQRKSQPRFPLQAKVTLKRICVGLRVSWEPLVCTHGASRAHRRQPKEAGRIEKGGRGIGVLCKEKKMAGQRSLNGRKCLPTTHAWGPGDPGLPWFMPTNCIRRKGSSPKQQEGLNVEVEAPAWCGRKKTVSAEVPNGRMCLPTAHSRDPGDPMCPCSHSQSVSGPQGADKSGSNASKW